MYEAYVGSDYEQKKKNNVYKLWARPTIPWKLECELQRSEAIELIKGSESDWSGMESGDKRNRMVGIFLIIGTIVCLVAACLFEEKDFKGQVASYAALFLI